MRRAPRATPSRNSGTAQAGPVPEPAGHLRAMGNSLVSPADRRHARHSVDSGAPRHRSPVEVSLLSDQRTDRSMMRHDAQPVPIVEEGDAVGGATDTRGGFGDRLEHQSEIGGRAADDAEHVAGRFLALQALREALLEVAKPCVYVLRDVRAAGAWLDIRFRGLGRRRIGFSSHGSSRPALQPRQAKRGRRVGSELLREGDVRAGDRQHGRDAAAGVAAPPPRPEPLLLASVGSHPRRPLAHLLHQRLHLSATPRRAERGRPSAGPWRLRMCILPKPLPPSFGVLPGLT